MLLARVAKISPVLPMFIGAHFSHHVATGALVPLTPWLRDAFSLNYTQSGLLLSSFTITYGLFQIPAASLADRWSKTRIIGLGLIGVSVMAIGVGISPGFGALIAFLILMGICGSTYHPPASSFLSQWFSPAERGRALGTHLIGGSASLLFTPIAAVLISTFTGDWRWAFIALGAPAFLLGMIVTTLGHRYEKAAVAASTARIRERVNILEMVRLIGVLLAIAMISQLFASGINSFLPLYLVDKHGVSKEMAGMVSGFVNGAGILGAPLGGALSDRLGRKPIILLSVILTGPMIFLITAVPFGALMLGLVLVYGLVVSFRMPSMESFIADTVPFQRRATVLGIYFFLSQETTGIVTPVVGAFNDGFGITNTFTGIALISIALSASVLIFRNRLQPGHQLQPN